MKTLLSVDRLAELLGVARATIYEWCSKRQIPFIKVGARNMFDEDEISRWLNDRRIEDANSPARDKEYAPQSSNAAQSEGEI